MSQLVCDLQKRYLGGHLIAAATFFKCFTGGANGPPPGLGIRGSSSAIRWKVMLSLVFRGKVGGMVAAYLSNRCKTSKLKVDLSVSM